MNEARMIPVRAISSLRIPYAAVATDLETQQEVVFRSGNLFEAIRASMPENAPTGCAGGGATAAPAAS